MAQPEPEKEPSSRGEALPLAEPDTERVELPEPPVADRVGASDCEAAREAEAAKEALERLLPDWRPEEDTEAVALS